MKIDSQLTAAQLAPAIQRLFDLSARKILSLEKSWKPAAGTPVFTVNGRYTSRGWTEWTQGFQFGSALLQFDATGDQQFLAIGRRKTVEVMASHVSHVGVHDHGFNNVSTYGNLLRLMREGRLPHNEHERNFLELALKVSGAIQAARWTRIQDGTGFIHSFNGAHSLFVDTIRSCRALAVAHRLGHILMGEQDRRISLLQRLLEHAGNTARYNVFYGEGRDAYDVRGRTAHEAIFNVANGEYRCPSTQQGFSPFTTWTRGLAWALCGFAEELEFLETVADTELDAFGGRSLSVGRFLKAASATADFYLAHTSSDGIPLWDTGAPNAHRLGDYTGQRADPCNRWEPVDSSAAAIAAQGLLRLGNWLLARKERRQGKRYRQAGLTVARTLLNEPYLSTEAGHQGLLLHSIYHRPNAWDHVARRQQIPNGESSMWGDYHLRELALLLWRETNSDAYPTFFGGCAARKVS
jgi:hypothetical protein